MHRLLCLLLLLPFRTAAQEVESIPEVKDTAVILRTYVAGLKYNLSRRQYDSLQPGEALIIRAEPENKYDPRAIAIYKGGEKIGFIPAQEAETLGRILATTKLAATITNKGRPDGSTGMSLSIAVRRQ